MERMTTPPRIVPSVKVMGPMLRRRVKEEKPNRKSSSIPKNPIRSRTETFGEGRNTNRLVANDKLIRKLYSVIVFKTWTEDKQEGSVSKGNQWVLTEEKAGTVFDDNDVICFLTASGWYIGSAGANLKVRA